MLAAGVSPLPSVQSLPGGEGSLRACCDEHLATLVQWHTSQCSVHRKGGDGDSLAAMKERARVLVEHPDDPFAVPRDPSVSHCSLESCDAHDGGSSGGGPPFLVCSRCKIAPYCCKEHQVTDWPKHRTICDPDLFEPSSHE
jgi:hypothetical protein